ncbi:hypothetical protein AZA_78207 [Nitrospirillum viridazoti Y2]|nr:hypothetical protein AZA_78207 [Nitrospirillum amazonense Y2]
MPVAVIGGHQVGLAAVILHLPAHMGCDPGAGFGKDGDGQAQGDADGAGVGRRRDLVQQNAVAGFPALWRVAHGDADHLTGGGGNGADGWAGQQFLGRRQLVVAVHLAPAEAADLVRGLGVALVDDGEGHRRLARGQLHGHRQHREALGPGGRRKCRRRNQGCPAQQRSPEGGGTGHAMRASSRRVPGILHFAPTRFERWSR